MTIWNFLTKKEFVLIHNVCHAEIDGSKYENERLRYTIEQSDGENEYCLRVHDPVVDNGWRIEFSEIYRKCSQRRLEAQGKFAPRGVLVKKSLWKIRGIMTPRLSS